MLFAVPLFAARERQNIYLFDCTNSMDRSKIWEPAKSALQQTVSSQSADAGAEFILIPFGDKAYSRITFTGQEAPSHSWDKTFKAFGEYMQQARCTHISDVLRAGFSSSNPNKDTDIFLITDGDPNEGDSPAKVAAEISRWCGNHRNARLFYVLLKGASINPDIKQAIDQCEDAWLVDCTQGLISVPMPVSSEVYASLLNLDQQTELLYSDPSDVAMHIECNDPYFNVTIPGGKSKGGKIPLRFSLRGGKTPDSVYPALAQVTGAGGIYKFIFTVVPDDKRNIIANPEVTALISIERLTKLSLMGGTAEEIKIAPGAHWHDSFLWSKASEPGFVEVDLKPEFTDIDPNKESPAAAFIVEATDSIDGKAAQDFSVTYNGEPIAAGQPIIVTPEGNHLLRITFNTDAQNGKRYFRLVPVSVRNVGMINGVPAERLEELPVRTTYEEDWNPLKTVLFWTVIIILGALMLWFAVLRRQIYPTIKVGKLTFTGPDSYFKQKSIKGARKVVLTTRATKQSALSKLFTGKVIYEQASHFTPELVIVPASRKRIRFDHPKGWIVFPSATLNRHSEASVRNEATGQKMDIMVN